MVGKLPIPISITRFGWRDKEREMSEAGPLGQCSLRPARSFVPHVAVAADLRRHMHRCAEGGKLVARFRNWEPFHYATFISTPAAVSRISSEFQACGCERFDLPANAPEVKTIN